MDTEEQARAKGWLPEEEFKAEPKNEGKKWRSAEDFMDRASLFDKIDEQHRTIRNLQQGQQAQAQHLANIEKLTRDKVIKELQAEKAAAIKEGDVARVEEIRDKIDEVKEEAKQAAAQPTQPSGPPPEFVQWMGENSWYSTDPEMRSFADSWGVTQHQKGLTPQEVLKEVSKKVREVYPNKFRNPNKDSAPAVTTGSRGKTSADKFELTEMEETIIKRMIRAGAPSQKDPKKTITREEYVEQLRAARGA